MAREIRALLGRNLPRTDSLRTIQKGLLEPGGVQFVVARDKKNNKAIGVAIVRRGPKGLGAEKGLAWLEAVVVDRDHRRQGIGTHMTRQAVEQARQWGVQVSATVAPDNAAGLGVLKKAGLEKVSDHPNFYGQLKDPTSPRQIWAASAVQGGAIRKPGQGPIHYLTLAGTTLKLPTASEAQQLSARLGATRADRLTNLRDGVCKRTENSPRLEVPQLRACGPVAIPILMGDNSGKVLAVARLFGRGHGKLQDRLEVKNAPDGVDTTQVLRAWNTWLQQNPDVLARLERAPGLEL